MGDAASWATIIIGVVSIVVSIIALSKSYRTQREANALQQRILEIEEQREQERRLNLSQATLQPQLRKNERGSYRLYLVNTGPAEARNIRVKLDGKNLCDHAAYIQGEKMPSLVGPYGEASCILALTSHCSPPFDIEIQWDDDSGIDHRSRTTLTF